LLQEAKLPQRRGSPTFAQGYTPVNIFKDFKFHQHRCSQRVQWVHLHPQGGEKFFSGIIYGENV